MIHEAMLWEKSGENRVECRLCAHRCVIRPGGRGVCGVRENRAGALVTLVYGETVAANLDPIEKKPLFHFRPGSRSLSVATAGCNFRCSFCQNWNISQAFRLEGGGLKGDKFDPGEIVRTAVEAACPSISYTYTEPTIFFEYARETGILARESGLFNVFVTNGYLTPEAIDAAGSFLDAANVDLKFFRDASYRNICGARLAPVLETIRLMKAAGIWVEVTTLVVPGLNDGDDELRDAARFLAGTDRDMPWHISRFHPDYEYGSAGPTPIETLRRAAEIGREEGLHYVYVGNVMGEGEDTCCPSCRSSLIRRRGFRVLENRVRGSKCPQCGAKIAGVLE